MRMIDALACFTQKRQHNGFQNLFLVIHFQLQLILPSNFNFSLFCLKLLSTDSFNLSSCTVASDSQIEEISNFCFSAEIDMFMQNNISTAEKIYLLMSDAT